MATEHTSGSTPDGHRADMVRPYLVPHEQQRESRLRVGLVCTPHGMVVIR
ncbi:hypothetical protein AB4212_35480 [Streptomyces sp. 2MCAF27]